MNDETNNPERITAAAVIAGLTKILGQTHAMCEHQLAAARRAAAMLEDDPETMKRLAMSEEQIEECLTELKACSAQVAGLIADASKTALVSGAVIAYCERAGRVCMAAYERLVSMHQVLAGSMTTARIRLFQFVSGEIRLIGAEAFLAGEAADGDPAWMETVTAMVRCAEAGMSAGEFAETADLGEWLKARARRPGEIDE